MHLGVLIIASLSSWSVTATLNEPCYGPSGVAGVCVKTSDCTSHGGTAVDGACPWDGAGIKCCSKPACRNGASGNCRWASDCLGSSAAGQCPGPAGFSCCSRKSTGFGGYSAPAIPDVGACQRVAVAGARKIVAAFPGRVREVQCVRPRCVCGGKNSDHCCGKATDMMCSDKAGMATNSGKEMAEWVMHNHAALNLKYVIWGQKIWNPSRDGAAKPWTSWRPMKDRGSITKNHWDHVHVSYN